MKHGKRLSVFAALALLLLAIPAFALWGRFPNDQPVVADNCPKSIVKAINAHKRVYGATGDLGWDFYFTGKTRDVNDFLAEVAKEKDVSLLVVLVPEPGSDKPDPFEKDLKVDYQWAIHLDMRQTVELNRKPAETDADYQKRNDDVNAKTPEFSATVTIHCVGDIDPADLKIPLRFNASVGGRLANLADFHNRRRADLEAEHKPLDSEPATDTAAAEADDGLIPCGTGYKAGCKQ